MGDRERLRTIVDCQTELGLAGIQVLTNEACQHKQEILTILHMHPEGKIFRSGASFQELTAFFSDQEMILRLFSLGYVLGIWNLQESKEKVLSDKISRGKNERGTFVYIGLSMVECKRSLCVSPLTERPEEPPRFFARMREFAEGFFGRNGS